MRKSTELAIRICAAVRYPHSHLEFTDPMTAVLTDITGRRRMIRVRCRRKGIWIWIKQMYKSFINAVEWIVPAVIMLFAVWLLSISIVIQIMEVKL